MCVETLRWSFPGVRLMSSWPLERSSKRCWRPQHEVRTSFGPCLPLEESSAIVYLQTTIEWHSVSRGHIHRWEKVFLFFISHCFAQISLGFLQHPREGALESGRSSRLWRPPRLATHAIHPQATAVKNDWMRGFRESNWSGDEMNKMVERNSGVARSIGLRRPPHERTVPCLFRSASSPLSASERSRSRFLCYRPHSRS